MAESSNAWWNDPSNFDLDNNNISHLFTTDTDTDTYATPTIQYVQSVSTVPTGIKNNIPVSPQQITTLSNSPGAQSNSKYRFMRPPADLYSSIQDSIQSTD